MRWLALSVWLVASASGSAQTYTWTTIAGSLAGTFGNADGTNNDATFYGPAGLHQDSTGTLYEVDRSGQIIRRLQRSGTNWITTTLAGSPFLGDFGSVNGTNRTARFNDPAGVIADTNGDLYVSESYHATIRRIRPVGTNWVVSTLAGAFHVYGRADGTNTAARFTYPTGMAFDASNGFYVVDTTNNTFRLLTPAGTNWVTTTVFGMPYPPGTPLFTPGGNADGTNFQAQFFYPSGITVDKNNGTLYVVDTYNNSVRKIVRTDTNWVTSTIAGSGSFLIAGSVDGTNRAALFNNPVGVAVDTDGALYIADSANHTIRKMTPVGTNWVTTTIGGLALSTGLTDGTNSAARFNGPSGITVDNNKTIHICDANNHVIREGVLLAPPAITVQPQPLAVTNGLPASFAVVATGTAPLFYQWQLAGLNLPEAGNITGATNATLSLSTTTTNDAGNYAVIVSNAWGSVTSSVAALTIILPPLDSVGDGVTDAWRAQYFGFVDPTGTTTNFQSCAACDYDGTGQNNLFKFLAGLDPTNSASVFRIRSVVISGADLQINWQAGGGRTNVIESTAVLGSGFPNSSTNFIVPGSGDVTSSYLDVGRATNPPPRYYRVRFVP